MTVLDWTLSVGPRSYRCGQVDRPRSGRAWTKADQLLKVEGARIPTYNSSLAYRGPNQLEKCTIWPAKLSRNVGKVVVWTCHGKKKYREYPKEYRIQSFLTIYTTSCKLYRSLEWKVDLTFKDIEERVDILKSCHMLPTWHVTSTNSHNVPQSCLKVVSKFSRCFADVVPKLSFSYVKVAQKMFLSCFKVLSKLC